MARFDSEQADEFVKALQAALTDEDAASFAGIAIADVRRWERRHRPFRERVRRIKAERTLADAGRVRLAARTDWRASLALMQLDATAQAPAAPRPDNGCAGVNPGSISTAAAEGRADVSHRVTPDVVDVLGDPPTGSTLPPVDAPARRPGIAGATPSPGSSAPG